MFRLYNFFANFQTLFDPPAVVYQGVPLPVRDAPRPNSRGADRLAGEAGQQKQQQQQQQQRPVSAAAGLGLGGVPGGGRMQESKLIFFKKEIKKEIDQTDAPLPSYLSKTPWFSREDWMLSLSSDSDECKEEEEKEEEGATTASASTDFGVQGTTAGDLTKKPLGFSQNVLIDFQAADPAEATGETTTMATTTGTGATPTAPPARKRRRKRYGEKEGWSKHYKLHFQNYNMKQEHTLFNDLRRKLAKRSKKDI